MNRISCFSKVSVMPLAVLVLAAAAPGACAQEKVFSGPQPGEKITPFKVFATTGPSKGKEVDYVAEFKGGPSVVVFVHAIERSLVPLLNVIDQYGAEKKGALNTVFVFLTDDRVATEQRLPLIAQSLRMQAPLTISLDGLEGPGNYGLNRKCMMTIVAGKENKVTANFALVQPGIADAGAVLQALAPLAGDAKAPTAEELLEKRRGGREGAPQRPAGEGRPRAEGRPGVEGRPAGEGRPAPEFDPAKLDVSSPEGLRAAFAAVVAQLRSLRREIAELKGEIPPAPPAEARRPADPNGIPGAAPTDPELIGYLRAFIQQTNEPATVDRILRDVESYVKDDPGLKKQAVDGWVRVLHLKYGTPYAQQAGRQFLERLKK